MKTKKRTMKQINIEETERMTIVNPSKGIRDYEFNHYTSDEDSYESIEFCLHEIDEIEVFRNNLDTNDCHVLKIKGKTKNRHFDIKIFVNPDIKVKGNLNRVLKEWRV